MAPHSSKMKSSVKPNASRSELSTASASSIVLVLPSASSQIWDAVKNMRSAKVQGEARSFVELTELCIVDSHEVLKQSVDVLLCCCSHTVHLRIMIMRTKVKVIASWNQQYKVDIFLAFITEQNHTYVESTCIYLYEFALSWTTRRFVENESSPPQHIWCHWTWAEASLSFSLHLYLRTNAYLLNLPGSIGLEP